MQVVIADGEFLGSFLIFYFFFLFPFRVCFPFWNIILILKKIQCWGTGSIL